MSVWKDFNAQESQTDRLKWASLVCSACLRIELDQKKLSKVGAVSKPGRMKREGEVSPQRVNAESIDLYINSICNLSCSTCFLGDEYFARGEIMTVEDAAAIARWAVRAGVRDVAILGGEPTLHPNVVDIFAALRDAGVGQTRLITNGGIRARALLATEFRDLVDLPYVSLDGASVETNDAVRGRGSFTNAIACIELLGSQGKPFVITSTLTRRAIDELDDLLKLAENSGATVLNLHWLSAVGRARGTDLPVPASEWRAVCDQVSAYRPLRADFTVECQVGWQATDAPWSGAIDSGACLVRSIANLQFMPDGRVLSCGLLADDVERHGFHWDGESLAEIRGETERTLCEGFCGSGCPVRQTWLKEEESPLPVCIYERVVVSAD